MGLPHLDDVQAATTTEQLADIFDEAFPIGPQPGERYDAHELLMLGGLEPERVQWLHAFIARWEKVQADEDFNSACAARGEG